MKSSKIYNPDLWEISQARHITLLEKIMLHILFIIGIASILSFADWWFRREHVTIIWLYGLFSAIIWYNILRIISIWFNYLHIKKPHQPKAPEGLKVAIFTTSYKGEPLEMVQKTLEACSHITYPHTTYLLDNTGDPAFREAAKKHGAIWLELMNIPGAKAGKINRALELTNEDYILVLDPDHIPFPNFLDCTLGYFSDPKIGFVQVSQAYYNQYRSLVAQGAAEQTYSFYGPTQMGYYGLDVAIAIGANCTFRRSALQSIGGHAVGLAEDLQTSIKLHAAGWKSVYNPIIVSRGIVPEDFDSFCKQQLKWARGTFEVLFEDYPRAFKKLTWKQRFIYLTIATYYFNGFITFLFTLLPVTFIVIGISPVNMQISDFVARGFWIILVAIIFYFYTQRWMCHPTSERGFHWRAMALKYATWPVFFLGLMLSVVKKEIPYIPTPKNKSTKFSLYARPMQWIIGYVFITITAFIVLRAFIIPLYNIPQTLEKDWMMIAFIMLTFIMSIIGLFVARPDKHKWPKDPWDIIDIYSIFNNKICK
jgi:cellulose synthase (UDP-forming)